MSCTTLCDFRGREEREESSAGTLPDTPPEYLLNQVIPSVDKREPIRPDNPDCDIKTGDLVVHHIGEGCEIEHFAVLILSTHSGSRIGVKLLHNQNYLSVEIEDYIDWEQFTHRVYKEVASVDGQQEADVCD